MPVIWCRVGWGGVGVWPTFTGSWSNGVLAPLDAWDVYVQASATVFEGSFFRYALRTVVKRCTSMISLEYFNDRGRKTAAAVVLVDLLISPCVMNYQVLRIREGGCTRRNYGDERKKRQGRSGGLVFCMPPTLIEIYIELDRPTLGAECREDFNAEQA